MEIRDLFISVLLARLSSHTSHLRIHLPFQAQGQHDVRLKRECFHFVPFSGLLQWCLHPGSVADIRHLDNISKGVSPSSPILVLKSSQNVTSTTQTFFRVDFQHRENLLLLFCPAPRFVSQELIWNGRACSHSSHELIRGKLAPLIVSSLLLWSWSSASRVTPSTSSTPHSHLRRFYQKHVFFESWFDSFDTRWSPKQIGRKIAKKGGISCQRSPIYRRKVTFCREDREMWRG